MNKELQRAITAGVVVQTQGGHRCRVCDKDVPEILPHLRGRDHQNNLAWEALSNPTPHQFLLEALPSVVREAKQRGQLEVVDKTHFSYRCLVCPRRSVSNGIGSLEAHLKGKEHEKAKRELTVYTSAAGAPPPVAALPAAVPLEARGYDFELQRALTAGVVAEVPKEGGPPSFKCRACDKDFTGSAPCLEHLKSDKHKKKIMVVEKDGLLNVMAKKLTKPVAIGGGRTDPGDESKEFKWRVLTRTRPFPPSDFVYRNLSVPRGLVLIFNYFTGQGKHERLGASRDSFNLKTLFDVMGYQVYLYEDYSKSKTEEKLTHTLNNPCLKNYDSFIVFILSHGKDDQIFFTTSFNEEDSMKLDDVRNKFTDTACPLLRDKPKLFFVNFCRATAEEQQKVYDGTAPYSPGPKNIVTMYSCIDTFMSPRDKKYGTFFVLAWCDVLAAHAYNEELRDLHLRVCQRLENMRGSVPELQDYFFKKFYFNPVNRH